jgi:hypothetical protein
MHLIRAFGGRDPITHKSEREIKAEVSRVNVNDAKDLLLRVRA